MKVTYTNHEGFYLPNLTLQGTDSVSHYQRSCIGRSYKANGSI